MRDSASRWKKKMNRWAADWQKRASWSLCVFWLTIGISAVAGGSKISRKFDLNGDGAIDFDEFQTTLASAFDRLDRNHDGRLSRSELIGQARNRDSMDLWLTEARMSKLDKNEDTIWTRDELL